MTVFAVAEADLRLVDDVLVEVLGDQFHPLALHAPLVDLAGIDQLAAVDDHKLVRRVDTDERIVVVWSRYSYVQRMPPRFTSFAENFNKKRPEQIQISSCLRITCF